MIVARAERDIEAEIEVKIGKPGHAKIGVVAFLIIGVIAVDALGRKQAIGKGIVALGQINTVEVFVYEVVATFEIGVTDQTAKPGTRTFRYHS